MWRPHPPPSKWFLFILFFLTLSLEFSSPATIGPCEERCETDRPFWSTKPYTLSCEEEYGSDSTSEIASCRSSCNSCIEDICHIRNSDIYNCPSKFGPSPPISETCKNRCDKTRPVGTAGPYTLSCKAEYDNTEKLDECIADCSQCLRNICSPYEPDIFHCPSGKKREPISGRCKSRCDIGREPGTTAAYILKCKEKYEFEDEVDACKTDCESCENDEFCPEPYSDNAYFNCPQIPSPLPPPPPPPPPTYEGYCKKHCDNDRPKGYNGPSSEPYTMKCNEKYGHWTENEERRLCNRDCKRCPLDICDFKKDSNTYQCSTFQLERRCDDVCNANRKYGSTEAYTLKCSTAYSTEMEIQYCKDYCFDCSNTVCDYTSDNDTYNCPVYVVPSVERPDYYPDRKPLNTGQGSQVSTFAIVVFFIFLFFVVAAIGGCVYCCVRKSPMAPTGQYNAGAYPGQQPFPVNNYAQGQGYPMGGQQQQPYPVNFYAPSQPNDSSVPVARSVPTSTLGMNAKTT